MTKPVGYFAASNAAEQMQHQFGAHLEDIRYTNQLACLAILAKTAYATAAAVEAGEETDWSIANEVDCGYLTLTPELRSRLIAFDQEHIDDAIDFCAALVAQLQRHR